jgi:hypothetical protein
MARSTKPRLLLMLIALLAALGVCEIALRLAPPALASRPGQLSYETAEGEKVATLPEAAAKGYAVLVDLKKTPRPRYQFTPGKSFYLCYSDNDTLHRDWFDAKGRVLVRINQHGVREREEIGPEKPAGEKRIVCIGDSFTFGWGIPEELCWVRLLENRMREAGTEVRTVNCGAAGTVCVDEYWWGLRTRFHVFQPDAVIVTLCLNDLIPCSGLFVQGPTPNTGLRLLDRVLAAFGRDPMDLDPAVDWVGLLKALPEKEGLEAGMYNDNAPFEALWAQGRPQHDLGAIKTWCEGRKIRPMIVLWPFLQGLGKGRYYPFKSLHLEVAAECKKLGIPFLDLLPALAGTNAEDLWVTPADMHANPTAQRLVMGDLLAFVRANCGF